MIAYKQDNLDEAKKLYEFVLGKNSKNAYAHTGLGQVYHKMGDTINATRHYNLADKYSVDDNEKQAVAKNGFAFMHQLIYDKIGQKAIGNLETAIHFNKQAIKLDDHNADGYNGLGNALVKKGMGYHDKNLCEEGLDYFYAVTEELYSENRDALEGIEHAKRCLGMNFDEIKSEPLGFQEFMAKLSTGQPFAD